MVGRVAGITGVGLIVAIGAALGLTRLITGLLYQVKPADPVSFLTVTLLLLLVALLAGYLPARRAARVDPVSALRV